MKCQSSISNRQNILLLNPVAPILEGLYSCVVLQQAPDVNWVLYSSVIGLLTMVAGITVFRKLEPYFAETI